MKTIIWTAVAVFAGIWLWSKFSKVSKPMSGSTNTVPVDSGVFSGPFVDPLTGGYTGPGSSIGASPYSTQPVGQN